MYTVRTARPYNAFSYLSTRRLLLKAILPEVKGSIDHSMVDKSSPPVLTINRGEGSDRSRPIKICIYKYTHVCRNKYMDKNLNTGACIRICVRAKYRTFHIRNKSNSSHKRRVASISSNASTISNTWIVEQLHFSYEVFGLIWLTINCYAYMYMHLILPLSPAVQTSLLSLETSRELISVPSLHGGQIPAT